MSKCIYCLEDNTETSFHNREHVIPQSFGVFSPLTPYIQGDVVCDVCNSKILSSLEVNFIEDSMEGFMAQRLGFKKRNSIVLRNKNFKVNTDTGHEFLNHMLFLLKTDPVNKKLVPYPKAQVKFQGKNGASNRVFFLEGLKRHKKGSSKFNDIVEDLKKLDHKGMRLFAQDSDELEEMVVLLKDYGVSYTEKERQQRSHDELQNIEIVDDYQCTVNHGLGRVIAKIAFNYFAYCCIQDNQVSILYLEEFDALRNYIFKGEGHLKDFIVSHTEDPILDIENTSKTRYVSHVINFNEEDGNLVSRLTFFGCPAVYKVILGKMPHGISAEHFGCGHLFDIFSQGIFNLANRPTPSALTPAHVRTTFGIQKRYRFGIEK